MAEQTWQDRYKKMEESQNKLFARLDALLQALCQTYNISLSSLHGAANSVDDASETDNASDVVISTLLPFESDIRSSTVAAYNQTEGGVDDLCGNLATTEQKSTTSKQEVISASTVTTQAGKKKNSMDVAIPRRSGKEIVATVPNRVLNSVVNPLMLGKSSDSRLPRDASSMVPTPRRFDVSIVLPPPKPPDRVTDPTMMMNPPDQDINTAHPSPSNSIHLHGSSGQSSLPFQFSPQITFSVFNCHVFDEMPHRNRVRQADISHQFRNLVIRLGVFNTPVKLPPPEPPDCVFVSSSLPVLLLTAPPVNVYTIKEKGVGYDLTQLQSPGNFPSIIQHGRTSIFMNDKQVLLRFGNKISDHRDIAAIDEYLLNLYCKIGDVETARQVIVEMPKMIGCAYNSHLEKYIAVDKLEAKDILSYDPLKLLRLVINCGYEFNCVLDTPSRLPLLKPPDLIYCAMAIPLPPPKPPDRRGCAVVPAAAPKIPIEFSFISCIWSIEEYCIMKGMDKVMHENNYIEALIHGLHLLSGYACSIGIIVPAINSVLISITNALILCGRLSCNDVVVWSSLIDGWSNFDHCWMAHVDISLSMLRSALLPQLTFYSQNLILECIGVDKNQVPELENDQQLKVSLRPFDSNETPSISQANLHVIPKMDILKVCYNNSKIPFNSNLMIILWKTSNYDDNIAAHVFFLTLFMAELFGLFSKEFMEVKSLVSVDWEQMVVEMLDRLETNLILLIDATVENRLQNRVSSCIGRLAHRGIQRWVLAGDTMKIVLTIGFACSLLFQGRQLIINCFNTPKNQIFFEGSDVKSAIGLVHHMQTRLLILGIFKSFASIGTKYIVMGFGSADCAILSLRAFFSLSFGSAQQWDPGGQFDMSNTTRTYQCKQWDPGKFVQQQLAPTLRTRLFLMGRVMS